MNNQHLVLPEEAGQRLDTLLATLFPEQSRGFWQRAIEEGQITVNGKSVKSKLALKEGQEITIQLPKNDQQLTPINFPIPVLYEDEDILVINKPAGIVVHPNSYQEEESVVQALLATHPKLAEVIYDPESDISKLRPGIVHRLDKDTSGVLVVAKNQTSLHNLAQQFHDHTTQKTYVAFVAGKLTEPKTIHTAIKRKAGRENVMGISTDLNDGREAISHFKPLHQFQIAHINTWVSEIECQIETGRTHQIRVHCKYMGMPVLGDELYGNKPSLLATKKLGAARQMLHARRLEITHPSSGEKMTFTAPFPSDMESVLSAAKRLDTQSL